MVVWQNIYGKHTKQWLYTWRPGTLPYGVSIYMTKGEIRIYGEKYSI